MAYIAKEEVTYSPEVEVVNQDSEPLENKASPDDNVSIY